MSAEQVPQEPASSASNESANNHEPVSQESASQELPPIPDIIRQKLRSLIEHNRFSNTIQFKNTKLLNLVLFEMDYLHTMTDLHQKSARKLLESIRQDNNDLRLSRTNHGQLAALIIRYDASEKAVAAVNEALLLERIAEEMSQAQSEERSRGNVHFIKAKSKTV